MGRIHVHNGSEETVHIPDGLRRMSGADPGDPDLYLFIGQIPELYGAEIGKIFSLIDPVYPPGAGGKDRTLYLQILLQGFLYRIGVGT